MRGSAPGRLIESVVRTVCGCGVDRIVRLTAGGLNEAYCARLATGDRVVVRIARRPVPWFTDEAHVMAQAAAAGVPTPEVLGVEHVEHGGELLSLSIQRFVAGRPLDELADELSPSDVERLVVDAGELLARVHGVAASLGIRHELQPPDDHLVSRVVRVVGEEFGTPKAAAVERAADLLRARVATERPPAVALAHGDWMPKHLLVEDGTIVGVIDWEFAGPASPAFDLGRWEVSVGDRLQHGPELLRRGYGRVADPDSAAAGWVPAFAIDWALEVLGWTHPADAAYRRRCVDVLARYADADR